MRPCPMPCLYGPGLSGRGFYSTYANLGTFLILWQMAEGFADPPKAKERLREAVAGQGASKRKSQRR